MQLYRSGDMQLHQICLSSADRGSYTAPAKYSCARYAFVLLTVVDIALRSTRLHFLVVLSLQVLIPVDVQLYRAGDIHLRQIFFLQLIVEDIQLWSTRPCRPKRHRFKLSMALDIQLR